jgi:hypothetical protein
MILHFPLVAPPGLKFKSSFIHFIRYKIFAILNPLEVKMGSYVQVEPTTRLLPLATTKHSTTNSTIYYKKGINKDNMEG